MVTMVMIMLIVIFMVSAIPVFYRKGVGQPVFVILNIH